MINYLVIGLYLGDYFPSVPSWVWIVGSVLLVTGLNILGIKLLATTNLVLVVVQFVFIAVFIALSLGRLLEDQEVQSFTAPFYEPGMETGLIFAGAAVLALSFLGFDAVSTLAEETREPRRRIPLAILLCALLGGLLYILESYVGHLVFPDYQSFADRQDVASTDVMTAVGAPSSTPSSWPPMCPGASPARWRARRACRASSSPWAATAACRARSSRASIRSTGPR